jgi:hypothetical protein
VTGGEGAQLRARAPFSTALIKIVVVLALLGGLGFLFVRSAINTQSEPYTVAGEHLRGWTLSLEETSSPTAPLLVLRSPPELARGLFNQVFARSGVSLSGPAVAAIPLVLQDEYDRAFAGHATPDALLRVAREAGLETIALEPRCLALRRVSAPGVTRQLYFVLVNAPAFGRFREQIAALAEGGAPSRAAYDPDALSPVLFIAASDAAFNRWLPLRAEPEVDCIAPIATREQ